MDIAQRWINAVVGLDLLGCRAVLRVVHRGRARSLEKPVHARSSWALVRMPRSIRTSWSIERVVFGFRRRDRHQRRAVEPLFVECGAERGGGLVDGLFLVAPTALTLANDPVIAFMVTL